MAAEVAPVAVLEAASAEAAVVASEEVRAPAADRAVDSDRDRRIIGPTEAGAGGGAVRITAEDVWAVLQA